MIPAPFEYERAGSLERAVELLSQNGDDAKLLAGGHSLLPLMKLRLATPALLVDVGRLRELSYVRDAGDHVAIGALSRHRDLETSELLRAEAPLVSHVAGQIGDPQVRHRGTIGGSLAHGDPASDLPGAMLALGASMVSRGPAGEREIPAESFWQGFLETALAPDEVLTEVKVPKSPGGWSYQKFNLRAQDWAVVGVAAVSSTSMSASPAVALVNMGSTPLRASATERALASGASIEEAAALAAEGTDPPSDKNASSEYRRHLARVLARRAIGAARAA
jgi:carbon-monoxide dehydrogenase medium subunit